MSIQAGEHIPEAILQYIDGGVQKVDTLALFEGRKLVLFAVPGAFTPTCSERHLPSFVEHYDEFQRRGIGVACMAVNDAFVMQAWGESQHVPQGLRMLSLAHTGHNDFADSAGMGTAPEGEHGGLSEKGRALIEQANRLGILIDQSHASNAVFDQMLALSKAPIVLSHSGAYDVFKHSRNIDDSSTSSSTNSTLPIAPSPPADHASDDTRGAGFARSTGHALTRLYLPLPSQRPALSRSSPSPCPRWPPEAEGPGHAGRRHRRG